MDPTSTQLRLCADIKEKGLPWQYEFQKGWYSAGPKDCPLRMVITNSDIRIKPIPLQTDPPPHKWQAEIEAWKRGETIQFAGRRLKEWSDHKPDVEPKWNDPYWGFRIKPAVKTVPLTYEDIPPGSAITRKNARPFWFLVIGCSKDSLSVFGQSLIPWEELQNEWLILRPGASEWAPCEKEATE